MTTENNGPAQADGHNTQFVCLFWSEKSKMNLDYQPMVYMEYRRRQDVILASKRSWSTKWKGPRYTAILDADICNAKTLIFAQSSKGFELSQKQHAYHTHKTGAQKTHFLSNMPRMATG